MPTAGATHRARRDRAAEAARAQGVAALLVSPGPDLAYLTGYRIRPSERLTCLVLASDGSARLVAPAFESLRASAAAPDLELVAWGETDDPFALVASLVRDHGAIAVADQMWAAFLIRLQEALRGRSVLPASAITRALRIRKDEAEVAALRAVASAADRAYPRILERPFAGRAERDVAGDLAALLREEGHDDVGFTIVASGPNGASPHHDSGERVISEGDVVVLDFGGTKDAYCSDLTRTVFVGPRPDREALRVHDLVRRAQEAAYAAAREGVRAADVDAAARRLIADAGHGAHFIHRTGHGIGLEGHEHPYLVAGNTEPLAPGMAFSLEPGVYLSGRFGVRIEDIAVIGRGGQAEPLNRADHALATVR